ncbi:glutathione S-transferase family protein [Paraferrimonas sedimenticola]|uniref:Glutathione S-transferase n=1 Tax=Paraferrimonas sedimenticola TaxID=375674 RepID=A0AA37RXT7_9GAMM|nr:glutathione S-transferase family protein [Paraferrimonas sedimenticola]GLP97640.1 glutathione S-transferase [Paraferrimonas sedimenticola]
MIKVVSFTICPFVQRITALLEAKRLPYEVEYISLKEKPQWFLDISPNGQVPVLITESGSALFESDAIAEYLDDAYPALEAQITAEQKALDRAWSYQASKHYLAQCSAMRSADKDTLIERMEKLAKSFAKVEKILGEGPYFKGESLSNVDMAWLPLLHRANIIRQHTCFDMVRDFPKVQAWQSALMATGIAKASVSDEFENKFTNFYLDEATYLGRELRCCKDSECQQDGNCCSQDDCCRCQSDSRESDCCDTNRCESSDVQNCCDPKARELTKSQTSNCCSTNSGC